MSEDEIKIKIKSIFEILFILYSRLLTPEEEEK